MHELPIFHRNTNYRRTAPLRNLFQEVRLHPADFVYPLFLIPGNNRKEAIVDMPDIYRQSLDGIFAEIEQLIPKGITAFLLFGVPDEKNPEVAFAERGFLVAGIRQIKQRFPDIVLITDICLCSYTAHGHCGHLDTLGEIDNDATILTLGKIAAAHAAAGADIVAPSAMCDGQITAIRSALNNSGQAKTLIMSYAAKFASHFYGPFREAAHCAPAMGNRKSYQLPYPNRREALQKVQAECDEGADILMVKPALLYLDIIREVRENFLQPVAAYNVSGEYASLRKMAEKDPAAGRQIIREALMAIKRSGADIIISYHAKDITGLLET